MEVSFLLKPLIIQITRLRIDRRKLFFIGIVYMFYLKFVTLHLWSTMLVGLNVILGQFLYITIKFHNVFMTRQKCMPPKSKGTERILYQKHILFTLNEPYFIGKVLTIFIAYFYFIIHFDMHRFKTYHRDWVTLVPSILLEK